jgi:hypothetical protein
MFLIHKICVICGSIRNQSAKTFEGHIQSDVHSRKTVRIAIAGDRRHIHVLNGVPTPRCLENGLGDIFEILISTSAGVSKVRRIDACHLAHAVVGLLHFLPGGIQIGLG